MNTMDAAQKARVTASTIRTWCRRGVIAAAKVAGRWVIEATSLARRIEIGRKTPLIITDYRCGHRVIKTNPGGNNRHWHQTQMCPDCQHARTAKTAEAEPARRAVTPRQFRRTPCDCASGRYSGVCTCC
jgi:hypothetical protein